MSSGDGGLPLPLHVESRGSGPPILLLHGYAANAFSFHAWTEELSQEREVILVELKGFGAAPKPEDDRYGPKDLAELVVRLIQARDLRDLCLLGHSFGGGVALLVAIRLLARGELDRLSSLVIVSGAAYHQPLPPFARWASWPRLWLTALRVLPSRALIRRVLRTIVHDPATVTRTQVEAYSGQLRSPEGRRAMLEVARRIVPPDLDVLVAQYPDLHVPALLLWGRQDPVVPLWVGERLERELPAARLVVLDACGHLPAEERPRESLAALLEFLREGV
ncbi:MAG TPA: alpha/beta fold hydrolase [Longimicrobiales bacterium]